MTDIPIQGPAFEAVMSEIDAKLVANGVDVTNRPIAAVGEVSLLHDITIPMGGSATWLPPEMKRYAPLGQAIKRWYDEAYGDKLKVDMCPGRVVVPIDGDLYVLKIPRIMGSVNFIMSRGFIEPPGISRGPATCNILQLVEDLTQAKANSLSDEALENIDAAFKTGLPAAYTLEATDHELMYQARGDVAVAVAALMDRSERYGASKWASLQAAEKTLKAAITLKGGTFKFTHELAKLAAQLSGLGVNIEAGPLIADIQCDPKIRYGDEPCTREQALGAHHASLDFVNLLRDAGVGFELGIGGPAE